MRISKRRLARMGFKLSLMACLVTAGFLVSNTIYGNTTTYAFVAFALSLVAAVGAEIMVTSTEDELVELEERISANRKRYAEALAVQDEKLAKLDRIAKILEDQNHDMRAELITTLVRKQRNNED